MRRTLMMLAAGTLLVGVYAARSSVGQQQETKPTTQPGSGSGQVRSITLPMMEVVLPEAPGKQSCQTSCTMCHSARYITLQPPFSRKAWSDEVQKMIKNYGAPVPAGQVEEIVNYLTAIRGAEATASAK
jgi:hypothetical protein